MDHSGCDADAGGGCACVGMGDIWKDSIHFNLAVNLKLLLKKKKLLKKEKKRSMCLIKEANICFFGYPER